MAGGGGGPGPPPGRLLGTVAVVVAGLGALSGVLFPTVRAVPKEKQHPFDLIGSNYVYGDSKHEVNVYVKVFTNSPVLICMDLALSQKEVVDPKYFWTGPDGKKLEGQPYVDLKEGGKLMVRGFKEYMSGAYTCTLSHKIIETTTQEEREIFKTYRFMVYAYREADHAYQIFVLFTTKECELAANRHFFEELKKILHNIISDLTCHIVQSSYKCHVVKIPTQGLQHELFVSFQVNPFAPGWKEVCHQVPYDCEDATNMRVQEVLCQHPWVISAYLTHISASASADMAGKRSNWRVFQQADRCFEAAFPGCSHHTLRGQEFLSHSHGQLQTRVWEERPHPPELCELLRGL
ncbi:zona pellucida-binding protein 2 isoform X2 [Heliangelus exortis]|uniref:zona pellucida-binding protein 2 isoform X2 n=1 Tax=Heliangelus exortis TaxID=472823 RepID=UPI003A90B09B